MGDYGTNGICVKLLIKATIIPQNILRITNDIGMYMEKKYIGNHPNFHLPCSLGHS